MVGYLAKFRYVNLLCKETSCFFFKKKLKEY